MSHELDRRGGRNRGDVLRPADPWHREGTLLADAPSLEKALRVGGLDFEVEVRPLFTRVHQYAGVPNIYGYQPAANACATVRTDKEAVLGVVSRRYQPLQNRDAFGVLEPLLDAGPASLETGGSLRDGRDVWMLVRFNVDSPLVREVFADELIPFGLFCPFRHRVA